MLIDIKIKTINDEIFYLKFDHDTKICDVKQKVKETTSIPEERQRLIYKGRVLHDENVIEDYQIENGHTIHMVVRPADYEELQQRQESSSRTSATSQNSSLQTLLALAALTGEPLLGSTGRGQAETSSVSERQSLEAIRQGLLTTHTFFSAIDHSHKVSRFELKSQSSDEKEDSTNLSEDTQSLRKRKFYVGQWLDVKDTVNQWLEATVMDINYETKKIFVHYNGWPPRWDEWIDFASERITPFRTRTVNVTTSQSSPMPCNEVNSAPQTGPADVRHVLPELSHLVNRMQPMLQEAAALCVKSRMRDETCVDDGHGIVDNDSVDITFARDMPWVGSFSSESFTQSATMQPRGQEQKHTEKWSYSEDESYHVTRGQIDDDFNCLYDDEKADNSLTPEEDDAKEYKQLIYLIKELSPLLDRLGRAMTDTAPHLMNLQSSLAPPSNSTSNNTVINGGSSEGDSDQSILESQQQNQQSSVERLLESLSLGISPLQRDVGAPSGMQSYRSLVTTPNSGRASRGFGGILGSGGGGGGGGHLDIHIHTIVASPRENPPIETSNSLSITNEPSTSLTSPSSAPPATLDASLTPPTPSRIPPSTTDTNSPNEKAMDRVSQDCTSLNSDCSDSTDSSQPSRTLLEEEEEEQCRRRRKWCSSSGKRLSKKTDRSHSGKKHLSQDNDDVEEMYDANFGSYFHSRRSGYHRTNNDKSSAESNQSNCKAMTSSNNADKVRNMMGDSLGVQHGCGDKNSVASKGKYSSGLSANLESGGLLKESFDLGSFPAQPSLPSRQRVVRPPQQSPNEYDGQTTNNKFDPQLFSDLEREVTLLADQTQSHSMKDSETTPLNSKTDESRRRKKNMSFAQRVRRSLSSLHQNNSNKSSKKKPTKANDNLPR